MFRVDDPTAVAALPTPEAAGTPGYFTEGVPGSTSATLVRASFLNMLQEEMISILTAAGVTPSKTTYNQVLTAIEALIQKSAGNYALDTGAANAYAATFSPAVTALSDGMVLKFKAAHANTGASTFSPNGLTAQPIYGGDHAALTGGEIVANGDVWLEWNSSLNGGSGAFVIIDSTDGFQKISTPPQFDATTKAANMAAVQQALGNYSGYNYITTNATLTAANAGNLIGLGGAGGNTLSLASAANFPSGVAFLVQAAINWTISAQAGETIYMGGIGSQAQTQTIYAGEAALLVRYGASTWYMIPMGITIGERQGWSNQTSNRAIGTTYTNTTGRPKQVSIIVQQAASTSQGSASLSVNALTVDFRTVSESNGTSYNNVYQALTAIIPPGGTYSVTGSNASIYQWNELS